ncbi:MAG: (Fe-S)-binding protein, partial [Dehalococcoidales bacterium]|nr:(Fe-S)-binding protein [Dehalococcoidales bacterium]
MSLIRRMDESIVGAELPVNIASFQKKLGIDLAGLYRKVMVKGGDSDAQPLRDAVKVLNNLGIEFGYLAEEEPCCGGPLHYIGLEEEFAKHAQEM